MRSAETLTRWLLLAVLCAGAAGCASLGDSVTALRAAVTPAAAPAAPTAPASAPAQPAVAPVNPAVQRSFDEATRALRAGRTAEAERGFKALAQSNPELGGPHANLGVIHLQAGRGKEAVAALEQAVRASPEQPLYFNQLGIAYRQQGQFDKARGAYEAALALDPNLPAALLNLGILHDLYLGDAPRALALYERYLAQVPGGDATVTKWIADLKNRKPQPVAANGKEKS